MFWPPPHDEDEGCVVDLKGLEEKSDGLHNRKGCMFGILACVQLTQSTHHNIVQSSLN